MHRGLYPRRQYPRTVEQGQEERETVKLWQRYQGKRCSHTRIMLNCKHCIDAARFEAQWNKQRSAS